MSAEFREYLDARRESTAERFEQIVNRVASLEALVDDFATVYATGSFGRGEASPNSDLDLFILTDDVSEEDRTPRLSAVNAIRLQAGLVKAAEEEKLPPFSDDGAYLHPHTLADMTGKLGGRDDDYENLFTARMLLLLESRPLVGIEMYDHAIESVLSEYWKDYDDNRSAFRPIYLTNDIIRYWKVLCLNYEANTRGTVDPNKRRLNNYKLKHSRLLTCYSAILYFCHLLRDRWSISMKDARDMVRMTPIERLDAIAREDDESVGDIEAILTLYVEFLRETDAPKKTLLKRFDDASYRAARHQSGIEFGDRVFHLLKRIGEKTPLFRYLVV